MLEMVALARLMISETNWGVGGTSGKTRLRLSSRDVSVAQAPGIAGYMDVGLSKGSEGEIQSVVFDGIDRCDQMGGEEELIIRDGFFEAAFDEWLSPLCATTPVEAILVENHISGLVNAATHRVLH